MSIDNIIKNRKTEKALSENQNTITNNDALIQGLLELAAAAPYHFKSNSHFTENKELDSSLPYRFYVADSKQCRSLSDYIVEEEIKAGKIRNMLNTADVLLMVTWLPEIEDYNNVSHEAIPFTGNLKNMEHIAAASAAIQNVLIGANSRSLPNYWSSGGQLRNDPLRSHIGIPTDEILLGAIFVFPNNLDKNETQFIQGALRHEGKTLSSWSKRI
jgi:nitroreductase